MKGYASNGNRKSIHIYNYNKQTSNKIWIKTFIHLFIFFEIGGVPIRSLKHYIFGDIISSIRPQISKLDWFKREIIGRNTAIRIKLLLLHCTLKFFQMCLTIIPKSKYPFSDKKIVTLWYQLIIKKEEKSKWLWIWIDRFSNLFCHFTKFEN